MTDSGPNAEEFMRLSAIRGIAGGVAEETHTGVENLEGLGIQDDSVVRDSDWDHLYDWLIGFGGPDQQDTVLDEVKAETELMIEKYWADIEKVAHALLQEGTLDTAALERILGPMEPRKWIDESPPSWVK